MAPTDERDGTDESVETLVRSYVELCDARPGYDRAEAFFEGSGDEFFATEKVQQLLAKAGLEQLEQTSYAHIPVTTVANRLQIRAITATTDAAEQANPREEVDQELIRRANAEIDRLIKRNKLSTELRNLILKTCEYGDYYMFVWPVTEETAELDDDDPATDITDLQAPDDGPVVDVDMFIHSPMTVRVFYSDENPLVASHDIKAWECDQKVDGKQVTYSRANMYYRDRIERWVTAPGKDGTRADHWQPYEGDGEPAVQPNTTGRLPFLHFRNNSPYGLPEHRRAYGPQQLIDKIIRAHAGTIDYLTFPQRYALVDPQQDQTLANYVDPRNPEDEDDDPEGDYNTSQLRADPSAVWRLRGMSSVGQFEPPGSEGFMAPLDRYVQAMAEVTETPLYRFGSKFAQTPSGQALREADAPTNNRVEVLQPQFAEVIEAAFESALSLRGIVGVRVRVSWKPPYRVNDSEGWQTLSEKGQNGVPVRQRLIEAGYTSSEVDDWLPDDAQLDLLAQVGLLNQIGAAVQSLGAGVGLGVLSQQQANQVVMRVLGGLDSQAGVDESRIEDWFPGSGKEELEDPKPPQPAPAGGGGSPGRQ